MAIILGQYIAQSNPSLAPLSNYALGLDIPMQMASQTFAQNYDSVAQLKANVTLLLKTPQGERLAQPLFGTKLYKLLFEPNDDKLEEKIYNEINTAVSYWIPDLVISEINVEANDELKDKNQVDVKVSFNSKRLNVGFNVDFSYNSNQFGFI